MRIIFPRICMHLWKLHRERFEPFTSKFEVEFFVAAPSASPVCFHLCYWKPRFISDVESRTQGSRPSPRTQKNPRPRPRTALPRTDPLEVKGRNARGHGQGPRIQGHKDTSASVLQTKKKVFSKIFQAISKK